MASKRPLKRATARKRAAPRAHRDLNVIRPTGFAAAADKTFWEPRRRTSVVSEVAGTVTVHCGDLSAAVIDFINNAESIVGCVAWVTSKPMLDALARCPGGAALVVQKETNLRSSRSHWPAELRNRYLTLPPGPMRALFPAPLSELAAPPRLGSVRCVGFASSGANANAPRMHHKFIVAGRSDGDRWVPEAVWTGSFNFSANAGDSFENAVVIADPAVAEAFLNEFCRVSALSEPLDWTSRLAKPEYRKAPAGAAKPAAAKPATSKPAARKTPAKKRTIT